jgi:hypothetical protein
MFKRRVRFAMAAATLPFRTCALGARAEEANKVSTGGAASLGRPTTAYFELGIFGGLLVPSSEHNLYDRTWEPFKVPVRSSAFGRRSIRFRSRASKVKASVARPGTEDTTRAPRCGVGGVT